MTTESSGITVRCSVLWQADYCPESSRLRLLLQSYPRTFDAQFGQMGVDWAGKLDRDRNTCACSLFNARRIGFIEFFGIQKRLWGRGRRWGLATRRNPPNRAQHHEFRIVFRQTLATKEVAENGDIAKAGNLVVDVGHAIVHQACNHETLSILQFKFRFCLTGAQGRNREAGNGQSIAEVEGAHFGRNLQMNVTVRHNDGSELQFDAEILEGDCNGRESLTGLDQRKWKLTASQETGFFTVDRDQIRLSQDLKQVLRLQCLNNGSEVNIRPEKKKVQNVINSFSACELTYLLTSESSELTCGGCPNRIP